MKKKQSKKSDKKNQTKTIVSGNLGRPWDSLEQIAFKKKFREHQERIDLQCLTLNFVYSKFFHQNDNSDINDRVLGLFSSQKHMDLLDLFKNPSNIEFDEQQNKKYISPKDILFYFHRAKIQKLQKQQNRGTVYFEPNQIFLLIFAYLYQYNFVNHQFYQYFNYRIREKIFEKILLEGPIQDGLDQTIVNWGLSLLIMEQDIEIKVQEI